MFIHYSSVISQSQNTVEIINFKIKCKKNTHTYVCVIYASTMTITAVQAFKQVSQRNPVTIYIQIALLFEIQNITKLSVQTRLRAKAEHIQ